MRIKPPLPGDTDATSLAYGRYRLEERLASGATATVWRARDEALGDLVAVKVLHPHLLPDERARLRFAAEARAAASLAHPGVVPVRDVVLHDDQAAIVFQFVDGETLAARLARTGPLPERDAANVAVAIADALAHAHATGVIHRDVKPSNVMLDANGAPRLVDFGIARSLHDAELTLTVTGTVVGTLRYMAPEQLAGEPAGPSVDVFAVGVVLYEMLAGHPPFRAETPVALVGQQRVAPPALPGVSPALMAITLAALRPVPSERIESASGLADLLRRWLAGDPVIVPAAGPAAALDTSARTAVVAMPRHATSLSPSRPPRRRLVALAAGVAGLLAIAALAFAGTGPGARPPEAGSGPGTGEALADATAPVASPARPSITPPPAVAPEPPAPTRAPVAAPPAAAEPAGAPNGDKDDKENDKDDDKEDGKGEGGAGKGEPGKGKGAGD